MSKQNNVNYLKRTGWEFDEKHGEWFLWDDETSFAFLDDDLETISYDDVVKKSRELKTIIHKNSPEELRKARFLKKTIKDINKTWQVSKDIGEARIHFLECSGWKFEGVDRGYWSFPQRSNAYLSDEELYKPYTETEFRNLVRKKELAV